MYHSPDVVLAADCVYFEPAFPLLLSTLEALIGVETTCWFCMKRRRKADARFVIELKKAFAVERVEVDLEGEERGVFLSVFCLLGIVLIIVAIESEGSRRGRHRCAIEVDILQGVATLLTGNPSCQVWKCCSLHRIKTG